MRWLEHIFPHLSSISSAHPNETLACENEQRAFLPSCDAGWVRVLALEDAEVLTQQDLDVLVISESSDHRDEVKHERQDGVAGASIA